MLLWSSNVQLLGLDVILSGKLHLDASGLRDGLDDAQDVDNWRIQNLNAIGQFYQYENLKPADLATGLREFDCKVQVNM